MNHSSYIIRLTMLLIGMKAIAEYCGISIPGLQGWIARRAFPAIKVGNTWQISTEQIKQWRKAVLTVKGRQILQAYSPPKAEVIVRIETKHGRKTRSLQQYQKEKIQEATRKAQERWTPMSSQPSKYDPADCRNLRERKLRQNLQRFQEDPSDES